MKLMNSEKLWNNRTRLLSLWLALVLLLAGILGYLVYSFFVFSIAIVTPPFWVLSGALDKAVRQLPSPEDRRRQ